MQEEYFPRQQASLPAFTEQSGVTVQMDLLPVAPFWHDARTACGDPPTWDLMVPDEVIVAEHMALDRLEPLGPFAVRDGVDVNDFLPAGIDRFRANGELYAIPYVAMVNVLIFRRDLLDRLDLPVPSTWDELRQVALAAQSALRAAGEHEIVGFTSRGLAGYGHNFWIIGSTLFPSWGWQWDRGDEAPPLVYSPETVDALELYAALLRETGPPDSASMTFTDTHAWYGAGRAVFLLDAATELATMRRESPESPGHHSEVAVVPRGPSGTPEPGLYSPAYCIPKTSARKEEAWQLLRFLSSYDEVLKDTIEAGYAEPARESVFRSSVYEETYDAQFREVVSESRRLARINRPLVPNGFDLGEVVGQAAESAISGERTAEQALREAQRVIDGMSWAPSTVE